MRTVLTAPVAGGSGLGPADWDMAADLCDMQVLAGVSGFTFGRR
ncbi:hypothetical protein ACIA8K_04865 [Catenuloplanes sp. NPDC051500]